MTLRRWLVMGRKAYNEPLITVVRLSGVIREAMGPAAARYLNEHRCEPWLARAFNRSLRPAAVAIVVNSPGGTPAQADLLYRLINRMSRDTGIPAYTFAEDIAASGGYWLLCSGKKMHALESSLVGSIGVISASFGAVEAIQRLGIERRVFASGKSKVWLDPFLSPTPDQLARQQALMSEMHSIFIQVVKDRRGAALAGAEDELFSGAPWTGTQALKLGLVDALGDCKSTMKAEFGDKARFQLCSPRPGPGLAGLFGSWAGGRFASSGGGANAGAAGGGGGGGLAGLLGGASEERMYAVCRAGLEAAMDAAEERALWERLGLR